MLVITIPEFERLNEVLDAASTSFLVDRKGRVYSIRFIEEGGYSCVLNETDLTVDDLERIYKKKCEAK